MFLPPEICNNSCCNNKCGSSCGNSHCTNSSRVVIDELVCATGNGIAKVVVVVVIVLIVVAVEVVVIVSTTGMELRSVDRLARFLSLPLQVELRLR